MHPLQLKTFNDYLEEGRDTRNGYEKLTGDDLPSGHAEVEQFINNVRNRVRAALGADHVLCFNKATQRGPAGDPESTKFEYLKALDGALVEIEDRIILAIKQRYQTSAETRVPANCP